MRKTILSTIVLMTVLAGYVAAQTHVYPGNSIQDAVNTTNWGGTVYIHPGTYNQHFYIWKNLALIGIPDEFVTQGTREQLLREISLDQESIFDNIVKHW